MSVHQTGHHPIQYLICCSPDFLKLLSCIWSNIYVLEQSWILAYFVDSGGGSQAKIQERWGERLTTLALGLPDDNALLIL